MKNHKWVVSNAILMNVSPNIVIIIHHPNVVIEETFVNVASKKLW